MKIHSGFPQTSRDVLSVIEAAERSRRFAWTAGRVLIEGALQSRWAELNPPEKKAVLSDLTDLMKELETEGLLTRRPELQSTLYGQEKAFDYVHRIEGQTASSIVDL